MEGTSSQAEHGPSPRLPDARARRELVPFLELREDVETEMRHCSLFASLSRLSST